MQIMGLWDFCRNFFLDIDPRLEQLIILIKSSRPHERAGYALRLASRDFILPETGKGFRFIVKQNKETQETHCFGSAHTDYSPVQILNSCHIRWPVETGIKDLMENYFPNKPTGTSPEKVEAHYYCVMLARLTIDYFRSVLCCRKWQNPEDWKCVLSTIRTTMFSNQNCELSLHDPGDLLLTFLDGDLLWYKNRACETDGAEKKSRIKQSFMVGGYRCSDCYQKSI